MSKVCVKVCACVRCVGEDVCMCKVCVKVCAYAQHLLHTLVAHMFIWGCV